MFYFLWVLFYYVLQFSKCLTVNLPSFLSVLSSWRPYFSFFVGQDNNRSYDLGKLCSNPWSIEMHVTVSCYMDSNFISIVFNLSLKILLSPLQTLKPWQNGWRPTTTSMLDFSMRTCFGYSRTAASIITQRRSTISVPITWRNTMWTRWRN